MQELEEYCRDWYNIPQWIRDQYAELGPRSEAKKWFRDLENRQKDVLRACTASVVDKYRGCGRLHSPEFGQYFLHAGGALTLITGDSVSKGESLQGCPCGIAHYKAI